MMVAGDDGDQGQELSKTPQSVVDPGSSPACSRHFIGCDGIAGLGELGGGTRILNRVISEMTIELWICYYSGGG